MQEINLYKLLAFYARNWLLILSLTLVGLLSGVVYNQFIQVPMYKSNATILFINPNASSSTQDATLLNNYVQLFKSRRVLEPVISSQNLGVTYDQFSPSVEATNAKDTQVIRLSVSTDNPQKSQRFLQSAVESFQRQAELLYSTNKLQVVDNASNAFLPFNVNKPLQLAIAGSTALIISVIVLFFVYDAKGGKFEKRVKKQKVVKENLQSSRKETVVLKLKNKKVKNSTFLDVIKEYFTTPKEDLMTAPRMDEHELNIDSDIQENTKNNQSNNY